MSATEHVFDKRYDPCRHGCCHTLYVTCSCGWERLISSHTGRAAAIEQAQLAHRLDVLEGKA